MLKNENDIYLFKITIINLLQISAVKFELEKWLTTVVNSSEWVTDLMSLNC